MNTKKVIIIVLVCLVLACAVLSFFHFFSRGQIYVGDYYKAVPENSSMIIEINDFYRFYEKLSENKIYNELGQINSFNGFGSLLNYLHDLSKNNNILNNIYSGSSVLVSYHIIGIDKIEQLVICPSPFDKKDYALSKEISELFDKIGVVNSRKYDNSVIYDFSLENNKKNISFTVVHGLFICGSSSLLVESSIRQLENSIKSLPDNKDFTTVFRTAGKNELANVYIHKQNFIKIPKTISSEHFASLLSGFENYGSWTELDLNISKNLVFLNGFSAIPTDKTRFVNVLESQSSGSLGFIDVLPDGTAMYLGIAINNVVRYDQMLNEFLKTIKKDKKREEQLSEIKKHTNIDLKSVFYPLVNNEICFAVTNVNTLDIFQNSFVIVGIRSKSQAENEIINMLKIASKSKNTSYHDYIEKLEIDEASSVDIYRLPFENSAEILFGPMFSGCKSKYLSFVGNYMVFSNSKESMFRLIHDAILNRTLATSIRHNKFLDNFSARSNMFFYFSTFGGSPIIENYLGTRALRTFKDNSAHFGNIGMIGVQATKSQNLMYNNIVVEYHEEIQHRPHTVWESRLDTIINMKPEIVINHNNNAKEIIIQDINNNLYLLSSSGREIWKIPLDEQITSAVYQVDYYKNNRLQYLFTTKSRMHLIDRLGNYVERYPLQLRAKSTGPLALYDYYDNREYRIFVPCEDKRIYLYDIQGNIISGWEFGETENIVTGKISHYRHADRDYIVFNDKFRAYILTRRGEERIRAQTNFTFSKNNKIWLDDLSRTLRFIATDNTGKIRVINENGSVNTIEIREFGEDHYFALKDVNRNGQNDFIFIDGNKLEVYTQNKKLLFEYEFPGQISFPPNFYRFPRNQIKIGIVCRELMQIYLINHDGTLFNGFPLQGMTQFSIGYLSPAANKFNLIVGGQDNLLYNYIINE